MLLPPKMPALQVNIHAGVSGTLCELLLLGFNCHTVQTKKAPQGSFFSLNKSLAVTYFRMQKAYYHWRWFVSRPCSRWEGVGPNRYGRQA
jgi:hypothetical protein